MMQSIRIWSLRTSLLIILLLLFAACTAAPVPASTTGAEGGETGEAAQTTSDMGVRELVYAEPAVINLLGLHRSERLSKCL